MGRYILCPYFVSEKATRLTITCEDCIRRFDSLDEKEKHIKAYCEASWSDCPFASHMNQIYERIEEMDEKQKMIELLKSQLITSRENNKRLVADVGREKKRREKAERTIADMNRIAERNNDLYRKELEGMRGKLEITEKKRVWAEAALGALLIDQNKDKTEFEIDTEKMGAALVAYRLELRTTEDGKVIAKVLPNAI